MSAAGGGQPPRNKGQVGGFEQRMAKGPDGEGLVRICTPAVPAPPSAQSYRCGGALPVQRFDVARNLDRLTGVQGGRSRNGGFAQHDGRKAP